MRVSVSDVGSNFEENLQRWARALGTGETKRKIFLKIYSNRKAQWSVPEIAAATGLDAKTVASVGRQMCVSGLFEQMDGTRVIYQKIPDVHHAKKRILRLAGDLKTRESLPTKRGPVKSSITNMTKVTNKFDNVGVANTGKMSGSITGNSQRIVNNESAKQVIEAFEHFRRAISQDSTLSKDNKEDALSAASQLEEEAKKPETGWNMSKVRNGVAVLKALSGGAESLHKLYDQVHPLVASHFHLLG